MTIRKSYSATVELVGERSIRAICSTSDKDMSGEVVEQTGIDLTLYDRNPIVLFAHNAEHPVGTASEVVLKDGKLTALMTFADEGVSHKADEVCRLAKAGILKTVSIGFDPIEVVPMDPSRPRGPKRYLKSLLCEISIVSIPANPNALITDKAYGSSETNEVPMPALKIKGLYDVGRLAMLMSELGYQHSSSVWEEAMEGDASEVPAKLLAVLHGLGDALTSMVAEEVAELLTGSDASMSVLAVDDGADEVIVAMSANPLVLKFREGYGAAKVAKAGKAVSGANASIINQAVDSHAAMCNAVDAHTKCMKALSALTSTDQDTTEDKGAAPLVEKDAAVVAVDAVQAHPVDRFVSKAHRSAYARALALAAS